MSKSKRFKTMMRYVEKTEACWNWAGPVSKGGLPVFCWEGRWETVNHGNYTRRHGKLPEGKKLKMKCDNPLCVNSQHWYVISE